VQKLDATLLRHQSEYSAGRAAAEAAGPPPSRVRVLMRITGDLPSIVAQGFTVLSEHGPVVAGTVDLADLDKIAALDNVVRIEAEQFRQLQLNDSVPEIHANQVWTATPGYTGNGVVVGIIDTGIDIFHHCFRNADGTTRIRWIWDQSLTPIGGEKPPPESGLGYGVEFSQDDIKAALQTPNQPFRHVDLNSHGTHVAGIAAGNGLQAGGCKSASTYIGVAPNADLIVVKAVPPLGLYAIIPAASPYTVTVNQPASWRFDRSVVFLPKDDQLKNVPGSPTQGQYSAAAGVYTFNAQDAGKPVLIKYGTTASIAASNMNYLDAVNYIFLRASTAGKNGASMPAVVNISLGGAIGAHDGSGNEEVALDYYVTGVHPPGTVPPIPAATAGLPGRVIVVANGNSGNHGQKYLLFFHQGDALHVSGSVPANGTVSFGFVISGENTVQDQFDLWYSGNGRLSFTLTNPAGLALPVVSAPSPTSTQQLGTDSVNVTSTVNNSQNNKHNINFSISPAQPQNNKDNPAIAAGTWIITLKETGGAAVALFDCWTQDAHFGGYPAFVPAPTNPSPSVTAPDPTRTVTVPGTANNVIAVGSYNPSNGTIANSSGSGPTADGRQKPDICAPGVGIMSAKTEQNQFDACCRCCLDYYVTKDGTSMAAPHVTGVVALMLEKSPGSDFVAIRKQIQQRGRPSTPVAALPNNDWGYGKIDALQSVTQLPQASATPASPSPPIAGSDPAPEPPVQTVTTAQVVPIAANWWAYIPPGQRLRALAAHLRDDATGMQLLALVSTHADEVIRLINTDRRTAVAWHRMHGPELIWEMLRILDDPRHPLFPARTPDGPLREGFARMLALLHRRGSPALRADVERYRDLLLALPGRPADALPAMQPERNLHAEPSWHARARRA